jgi:hypothetical protein
VPYADVLVLVLVLVAAVVVVAAAVLLFVVVTATAALAGSETAGAASAVVVAVVLSAEVVETGRTGVVAAGVVLVAVTAAGGETAGVVASGVVLVAVTAAGVETAGVVAAVGLAITDAAVTESELVPLPPPPHAASEVATRAERTRTVIVLDEIFMSIYSELRSVECCYRLFIVGLWNKSILIQGNRSRTEKVVFQQHKFSACHRNLTHFLLSLKDCYR